MILSFAFAGLFLVGSNVFGSIGDLDDGPPPAITCHIDALPGRCNVCYGQETAWYVPLPLTCYFTGAMKDICCI